MGVQHIIQECIVTHYAANGKASEIFLALQYRPDDPINTALQQLYPATTWRGDILVMKKGERVFVTSLAGQLDTNFVKLAVIK